MLENGDNLSMLNRIVKRYRLIPIPVRASLWFVVCSVIQNGCKFLSMPFLVRLLTTEEYGVYSVFLSWTSILSIFTSLNLHAGVCNNAMHKYPNRRNAYISASQSLAITVTTVIFVFYLPLSHLIDREVLGLEHGFVLLIFLQLLFTEGFQLWTTRQRYEYKYVPLLCCTALLSLSYTIIPLVSAFLVPADRRLAVVIGTGVAIQVLFGCGFIFYNYIKSRRFLIWEFWRYSLRFNLPLIPHYLSNVILGQADRVMIKKYVGASEAGIYSLVYTVSLAASIITGAVNNAIIPYTYEKMKKRSYADLQVLANVLLALIGGVVVILSALAPEIIQIIATDEYYDAIRLVPVIAVSVYFIFLYSLFGNIEFYFEANRFIAIASATAAGANIILNLMFIPKFGYYAAGYTTLFCYMLLSVAHGLFMRFVCSRKIGFASIYDGKMILAISTVVVLLAMGMAFACDYPLIRYLLVVIVGTAYWLKRKLLIKIKLCRE